MAGIKGVIGARPGTHRVKAHTKRTKAGIVTVREHTAVNALQTRAKTVSAPLATRSSMIKAGRDRAKRIQEVRAAAIANRPKRY